MAHVIKDRVKETTTTTGTGALTLAGAMTGFRAFSAVCSTNDTLCYALQAVDGNGAPTGDWEVGVGTYSGANTLTRGTVFASSNAGAAVNLASGTKQVWIDLPASRTLAAPLAKTANYTAVAGDCIAADTSSGAFTITLPSSPNIGDTITIEDAKQAFSVNNLTISPNGNLIAGMANNYKLLVSGQFVELRYSGSTYGWVVTGGVAPYHGTIWNIADSSGCHTVGGDGRVAVSTNGGWASMRATTSRSSGKLYFEARVDFQTTHSPMLGVGTSSATLINYVGADANGWGLTTSGLLYTNATNTASVSSYAAGDIMGVAVDFTASTGSIQFYKNNATNGSFTGLTLGTVFPMAATAQQGARMTLRTKAFQCSYSPPTGFSYWDS